jgi:signal transduction histidine kinase/CheY-like chemotaxis protein/ligand-binding sensor domain-containing protein
MSAKSWVAQLPGYPVTRQLKCFAGQLGNRVTGKPCFLLAMLVVCAASAAAEEWTPARTFRTFSKASWRGLPQSSAAALAQSSDGMLWIGTLDGVASFDGKTITPVPAVEGAPVRGVIAAIIPRAKGGVWVASQSGVHRFDGRTWKLITADRGAAALAESHDGTLWMADSDGVLWTLTPRDTWKRRLEMVNSKVVAVSAARDGAVWAATENGAARIGNGRARFVEGAPLPSRPGAILAASDGRVWIATQSCTVHWTRGAEDGWHQAEFTPWPRGSFRTLAEDRRGLIWAGSVVWRVAFGNASTPWTVWDSVNGPFEPGVMAILGDREGNVWFGLNGLGPAQWVGEPWSHRTNADPWHPSSSLFSSFGLSRTSTGDLLVGVFNNGALRLSKDKPVRIYNANDGLTEHVRSLVEPEPGLLLAATRFGIFESKNGKPFTQVLKMDGGFAMGFFRSPAGVWHAATTAGVYVRENGAWRPVEAINVNLENPHVRSMMWRGNGELWVATLRGISIFRDGQFVDRLTSRNQQAIPESVNALLEVSSDEVWAGGTGGIAVRRGGAWSKMTEGLPGETIYSLARARDGAIWAGGSEGVGRYKDGRWTVWDSRSGLLQEECNLNGLLVDDDGSVYAGTMSGLAHFDPSVRPLSQPELVLQWRDAPSTKLARSERALHLRWSAPWLSPTPVQYRVRVPRLRDEWSKPSLDDRLDVENLGAGRWRIEVEARVEGTNRWTAPLVLDVDVAPFWYETWPGRLAMLALLALLVWGIVLLRMRALRKHAAMLEATVRERTAELAESEQRALAASRAKSAFLANMSHELRTPLNGVLGFAQLLARKKNRDAGDRHGLDVIIRSGEHLLGLINDVLSLSKIEAGSMTLEQTRFDLRRVVRDVENVLRIRAEEKRIRFTIDLDDSQLPATLLGDEVRLRQILLNLAGNAVKFTGTGGVTLRGRWRNGRATFDIEDTGPGIAPAELSRLFAPFVQSESGRRSKEGTGLGLALSRNLARLMGGDITVESTPGRGSTFHLEVDLPAADAASETIDTRRVSALAPNQPTKRILVVDDTAINRTVLSRLLAQVGFEVREASNGEEAIAAWRSWKPHLIWMDWRMSGMDGLEATRRIRAEERTNGAQRTPILALSASALDHERGEILAAGCDEFVAKPFRESTIFAKLRDHLGVEYIYEDVSVAPPTPAAVAEVGGPTPNVLVVDDDWICREVATEILRGNGVGVTTAASGGEALDLLDRTRVDLVLMDLQMPTMSGVETARRIKSARARLPIIAMSADTLDGDSTRLSETGMDDYLMKPVEPDALLATVRRWLGDSR